MEKATSQTGTVIKRRECVKIGQEEITCADVARLALAIRDKSHFFSRRWGFKIDFSSDLNGSGEQGLSISREGANVIQVVFDTPLYDEDVVLYEADLRRDQRKDYLPTMNLGKHKFAATRAGFWFDWNGEEVQQWRADINRLSLTPDSLEEWATVGLDMFVRCGGFWCFGSSVIPNEEIAWHVNEGISLDDLKARFRCKKCGRRKALVFVF